MACVCDTWFDSACVHCGTVSYVAALASVVAVAGASASSAAEGAGAGVEVECSAPDGPAEITNRLHLFLRGDG